MNKFIKLSDLVGQTFTFKKNNGFKWKRYNPAEKKMEVSDTWQEGYRKIYSVETDKGLLDLGDGQLGTLLSKVIKGNVADLSNVSFAVKSNGKTGIDIRYFFNPVATVLEEYEEVNVDNIEF